MNRQQRRASAKRRLKLLASRPCGDCTACCERMAIPELDKPPSQRCEHQDPGCQIYAARPPSCRAFECSWRRGLGKPEHRPDLCGVLLLEAVNPPGCVVAYPLRADADLAAVVGMVQQRGLRVAVMP
jgi:hypothetical protein